MKKLKKLLLALTAVIAIPVMLAGCSFGKTTPQKSLADGQLWYVINGKKNGKVDYIFGMKNEKLTVLSVDPDIGASPVRYNDLKNDKTIDQVQNTLKKKHADCNPDVCNAKFYVFCDDSKKTDKEAILSKDANKIVLDNEKVSLENGKLNGFKVSSSADADVNDKSEYFVTNAKNIELDNAKNKNVVVEKINDEALIYDANEGYDD